MTDDPVRLQRQVLKFLLSTTRVVFTPRGYRPVCAYCNGTIMSDSMDMHEVFITRGDIRMHPELARYIMVKQNCVLLDHGECHKYAPTKEGQRRCIEHLVKYESLTSIETWLLSLIVLVKDMTIVNEGLNKLRLYGGLDEEMSRVR